MVWQQERGLALNLTPSARLVRVTPCLSAVEQGLELPRVISCSNDITQRGGLLAGVSSFLASVVGLCSWEWSRLIGWHQAAGHGAHCRECGHCLVGSRNVGLSVLSGFGELTDPCQTHQTDTRPTAITWTCWSTGLFWVPWSPTLLLVFVIIVSAVTPAYFDTVSQLLHSQICYIRANASWDSTLSLSRLFPTCCTIVWVTLWNSADRGPPPTLVLNLESSFPLAFYLLQRGQIACGVSCGLDLGRVDWTHRPQSSVGALGPQGHLRGVDLTAVGSDMVYSIFRLGS